MADDLDVLDPPGHRVTVAGQSLTVKPLTIGQLPRFARAIRPAAPLLAGNEALAREEWERSDQIREEFAEFEKYAAFRKAQDPDWLALIADHGEALIEAAAVATGIESKEIEALAPDEFVLLCGAIFEANVDFFLQRLAPAMERASDRIVAASARIETGATAIPSRPS